MGRKQQNVTAWGKRAITNLENATGVSRVRYYHPEHKRLSVVVHRSGSKLFQYYYRSEATGRPVYWTLGEFPDMSPTAAVDAADRLAERLRAGSEPAQERQRRLVAPTLDEYWTGVYTQEHFRHIRESTATDYERVYRGHIKPRLGAVKLEDIARGNVREMHREITSRGKTRRANLAVAVIRSVLSFAIEREDLPGPNPLLRMKLNRENKRDTFLNVDQIARLYKALDDYQQETGDDIVPDIVRLLLLTGARRENIVSLLWDHVDLHGAVLRIPGGLTKSHRPYTPALSGDAVAILQRRLRAVDGTPKGRVFPERIDGLLALNFLRRGWCIVRDAAELPKDDRGGNFRLHDLRHTTASLMAARGASLAMIGHQLGHASLQSTARYAHLVTAPVAQALAKALESLPRVTAVSA